MVLKIVIYIVVVLGLLVSQYKYGLLDRFDISENIIAIFLLIVYLFMFYLEVRPQIGKGMSYKQVKHSGFVFSFCVGIIWGIIMSLGTGFPKTMSPFIFLLMIGGYIAVGALFGLFGIGFSKFLWKRLSKNGH